MWETETGSMCIFFLFSIAGFMVWVSKAVLSPLLNWLALPTTGCFWQWRKSLVESLRAPPPHLGVWTLGLKHPSLLFPGPSVLYENYPPPHAALSDHTHTFIHCMYLYLHLPGSWKWNCRRKLSFNWQLNSPPGSLLHGKMIRNEGLWLDLVHFPCWTLHESVTKYSMCIHQRTLGC